MGRIVRPYFRDKRHKEFADRAERLEHERTHWLKARAYTRPLLSST